MRAGGEGTTPYPLLSSESFRNVLLSESVIAEWRHPYHFGDVHISRHTYL